MKYSINYFQPSYTIIWRIFIHWCQLSTCWIISLFLAHIFITKLPHIFCTSQFQKRRASLCLSQQALVTSFLIVSTAMTLKDPELIKKFYWFLRSSAAAPTLRVTSDEMAGDRLRQFACRNCYTLSRVSCASQISCLKFMQQISNLISLFQRVIELIIIT